MTLKEFWRREIHVAMHAQSWRFRIVKYLVIVAVLGGVGARWGVNTVVLVVVLAAAVSLGIHFFFRFKTDRWTKPWGPYKRIPLEDE